MLSWISPYISHTAKVFCLYIRHQTTEKQLYGTIKEADLNIRQRGGGAYNSRVFRWAFLLPALDQQMALYHKAKILLWHPVLNVPYEEVDCRRYRTWEGSKGQADCNCFREDISLQWDFLIILTGSVWYNTPMCDGRHRKQFSEKWEGQFDIIRGNVSIFIAATQTWAPNTKVTRTVSVGAPPTTPERSTEVDPLLGPFYQNQINLHAGQFCCQNSVGGSSKDTFEEESFQMSDCPSQEI